MAPFRNELEASHARIAQLEAEKAALERRNAQLEDRLKERHVSSDPRGPALVALIPTLAVVLMAVMAILIHTRHRACPGAAMSEPTFDGVATAHAPSPPLPLLREPRLAPPRGIPAPPCRCLAGDPLCSCLPPALGQDLQHGY